MGGLLTRRRARGDCYSGGYAGTVEIAVDINIDWAVSDRIQYIRSVKRFPGIIVCTGRLVSGDGRDMWYLI